MKKTILMFALMLSLSFVMFPGNAKAAGAENTMLTGLNLSKQVRTRYVRVGGKRYRVTYRLYKRNGRMYYRIISYRRA